MQQSGPRHDPGLRAASSETVIHTPFPRESPYISPSAQELFEQGISIGINSNKDDDKAIVAEPSYERGQYVPSIATSGQPQACEAPEVNVTTRGNTTRTVLQPGSNSDGPFLDRAGRGVEDPTGLRHSISLEILELLTENIEMKGILLEPAKTHQIDVLAQINTDQALAAKNQPQASEMFLQVPLEAWQRPEMNENSRKGEEESTHINTAHQANQRESLAIATEPAIESRSQIKSTQASLHQTSGPMPLRLPNTITQSDPGPTATSYRSRIQSIQESPPVPRRMLPRFNNWFAIRDQIENRLESSKMEPRRENKAFLSPISMKPLSEQDDLKQGIEQLTGKENRPTMARGESVFTPITITTGFGRDQSHSSQTPPTGADRDMRVAPATRRSSQVIYNPPTMRLTGNNLASFPRPLKSSTLQNFDQQAGIRETATISVSQLMATKQRTERLSRYTASGERPPPENAQGRAPVGSGSSTSTSMSHSNPLPLSQLMTKGLQREDMALNEALAHGAARVAILERELTTWEAASSQVSRRPFSETTQGRRLNKGQNETEKSWWNAEAGKEGTGSHSKDKSKTKTQIKLKNKTAGKDPQTTTAREVAGMLVRTFVKIAWLYWLTIAPCFDAKSPLRKRLEKQKSTWTDLGVWILASLFGFGVLVVLIRVTKMIKAGMLVGSALTGGLISLVRG
jgi:hypothetical protein